MEAFIGAKDEEIAFSKLIAVPRFLRFGHVVMNYRFGSQLIVQKCDLFRVHLSELKAVAYLGWGHRGHVPPHSGQVKEKNGSRSSKKGPKFKKFSPSA